jgi:hypothetical protein
MFWVGEGEEEVLFVGVEDFGAYTFSRDIAWEYLGEKIPGLMRWDYKNLADFLNRQLGITGEPQGQYTPLRRS